MNKNEILYHGAVMEVRQPFTHAGRSDLDFGRGFYLTNDRQQAIDWALTKASRSKSASGIVNVYHFDVEGFAADGHYKQMVFPEYNIQWLDFVAQSRKGQQPWLGLDWIEGGIANDHVISTVEAYIDGFMTPEMALDKLINERLHHQVCILNQEIIDRFLSFTESFNI